MGKRILDFCLSLFGEFRSARILLPPSFYISTSLAEKAEMEKKPKFDQPRKRTPFPIYCTHTRIYSNSNIQICFHISGT